MQPARERTTSNAVLEAMKADSPDGPHANWKTVDLDRGEVLFTVGDRVRYAFFPIGCVLSSLAGLTDGSTLEVSMFGPEGAAGVLGAVGSCDASTKVVVLVSGKAVRVPVRWLRAEFGRSERVRSALLRHIENVYYQAQQSALCASRHSVEARLARWLLSNSGPRALPQCAVYARIRRGPLGRQQNERDPGGRRAAACRHHHLSPRCSVDHRS